MFNAYGFEHLVTGKGGDGDGQNVGGVWVINIRNFGFWNVDLLFAVGGEYAACERFANTVQDAGVAGVFYIPVDKYKYGVAGAVVKAADVDVDKVFGCAAVSNGGSIGGGGFRCKYSGWHHGDHHGTSGDDGC